MIKLKTYATQNCNGGVLEATDIQYTVTHVEQMLELQSSELRFENMTAENLKIAANMFIYLLTCPFYNIDNIYDEEWFKSRDMFYKDLFNKNTSPDIILLTLNRMMKVTNENKDKKDGKRRAKKLFRRIADYLSLKHGTIQSLLSLAAGNIIDPNISKSLKSEGE